MQTPSLLKKKSRLIELLIGSDYYLELTATEKIELKPGLYLLGSKLGWILSGRFGERTHDANCPNASMLIFNSPNQTIFEPILLSENPSGLSDQNIDDFWRLENIGIKDSVIEVDDDKALQHFNETVTFKENRYYVTWHGEMMLLTNCLKTSSLQWDTPELLNKYNETIQDQLKKGIIEKVDTIVRNLQETTKKHHVPHHAVITPSKTSTKVSIVYDGSAKTKKEAKSINECLLRGSSHFTGLVWTLATF